MNWRYIDQTTSIYLLTLASHHNELITSLHIKSHHSRVHKLYCPPDSETQYIHVLRTWHRQGSVDLIYYHFKTQRIYHRGILSRLFTYLEQFCILRQKPLKETKPVILQWLYHWQLLWKAHIHSYDQKV